MLTVVDWFPIDGTFDWYVYFITILVFTAVRQNIERINFYTLLFAFSNIISHRISISHSITSYELIYCFIKDSRLHQNISSSKSSVNVANGSFIGDTVNLCHYLSCVLSRSTKSTSATTKQNSILNFDNLIMLIINCSVFTV